MLEIYEPRREDLWFKRQMLGDEATMSYNHTFGGVIPFPRERWAEWHERWVAKGGEKRFYRYLKNGGDFVGEISYHYDEERAIFLADVLIFAKYRGRGYGGKGLDMLCSLAKERGVVALYDEIAADNPAVDMFLRHGFMEISRNLETVMVKKTL